MLTHWLVKIGYLTPHDYLVPEYSSGPALGPLGYPFHPSTRCFYPFLAVNTSFFAVLSNFSAVIGFHLNLPAQDVLEEIVAKASDGQRYPLPLN